VLHGQAEATMKYDLVFEVPKYLPCPFNYLIGI